MVTDKMGEDMKGDDPVAARAQVGVDHVVRLYVRLNTPGDTDGAMVVWLDGALIVEKRGLQMRDSTDQTIDYYVMHNFFGGHTSDWAAAKTEVRRGDVARSWRHRRLTWPTMMGAGDAPEWPWRGQLRAHGPAHFVARTAAQHLYYKNIDVWTGFCEPGTGETSGAGGLFGSGRASGEVDPSWRPEHNAALESAHRALTFDSLTIRSSSSETFCSVYVISNKDSVDCKEYGLELNMDPARFTLMHTPGGHDMQKSDEALGATSL